jgi:hypothetical protein
MANWCDNTLTVKPKNIMDDIIKKYVRKDKKSEDNFFDFEKIIPIDARRRNENCHDECIVKWGTKWRPDNIICYSDRMVFATAWTPPIPIVKKLAGLYPSAQFTLEYCEPEMEIRGVYSVRMENGQIIENNASWEEIIEKLAKPLS